MINITLKLIDVIATPTGNERSESYIRFQDEQTEHTGFVGMPTAVLTPGKMFRLDLHPDTKYVILHNVSQVDAEPMRSVKVALNDSQAVMDIEPCAFSLLPIVEGTIVTLFSDTTVLVDVYCATK